MDKVGIITGAAGGVGRAASERFSKDGWSLVLTDVSEDVVSFAAELGRTSVATIVGVKADLTQPDGVKAVADAQASLDGPLRFLGLVAAVLQKVGPIETLDMAEWDRVLSVNLRANVMMMKAFVPALRQAKGASIVTVSSWFGRSGHGFFSAYCASKAALISLTHSAAAELAGDGIRVNSVAPGNIGTAMHFTALREEAEKRGISFEAMKTTEWDKIPLGRAAEPAEIAAAIAFLASAESSYMTGATIDVNGGVLFG